MFTIQELQVLYIFLNERASFNMSGKEADTLVSLKNRVLEEYKKLEGDPADAVAEAPATEPVVDNQ